LPGIRSTELKSPRKDLDVMAKPNATEKLSWPWWAPWALLGVALSSLLTVAATLYDIL
jgi:hypothetical protein